MKTKLLLIFLFLLHLQVRAQYQVTVSRAVYSDLAGATNIAYYAPDSGFYVNTSLMFKTFHNHYANFNLQSANPVSAGGFLDSKGMLVTYDTIGSDNVVVFQCFDNARFVSVPGITSASIKVEGTAGNRIFKFQWRNLVYDKVNSQTANFQIWLQEGDGSVSYHYGPNTLPAATTVFDGGYTGIVVVKGDGSMLLDEINLEGKPGTPQIYTNITSSGLPTLDSIPPSGTVYTFRRVPTAVNAVSPSLLSLYPNPVETTLFIKDGQGVSGNAAIYNSSGQLIDQQRLSKQHSIDVSRLASGMYSLWLDDAGISYKGSFIKR
jgi:hypothetical protein